MLLLKEHFQLDAMNVTKFILKLAFNAVYKSYAGQLYRSASPEAGNCCASLRAKSTVDFINIF